MGKIALSRHPKALFRQVMLAAVSISVAFSPVRIEVEAGGELREELHVDGGNSRKVFIAPPQLSLRSLDSLYSAPRLHRFNIIGNKKLVPDRGDPIRNRSKFTRIDQQEPRHRRPLPPVTACQA